MRNSEFKRSTVIDDLRTIREKDPGVSVIYFFFTFSDAGKQTARQMLATIAAQMLEQLPGIPKSIDRLYRNNSNAVLSTDGILEVVLDSLCHFKRTYLVLDALDEVTSTDRGSLLEYMKKFFQDDFRKMNVLFSSRKEWYLQEILDKMPIAQCPIQNASVDADIKLYVKARLLEDPKLQRWSLDIKNEIEDALTQGAHGM
jgi:hypothetical protein